jgi:hypothetical protein
MFNPITFVLKFIIAIFKGLFLGIASLFSGGDKKEDMSDFYDNDLKDWYGN